MTEQDIRNAAEGISEYVWDGKRITRPAFEEWLDDYIQQYDGNDVVRSALEVVRLMYRQLG